MTTPITNVLTDLRPEFFDEIAGQEPVVRCLTNMVARDQMPNALLLAGDWGTGKTTLARVTAKASSCPQRKPDEWEPCGDCEICRQFTGKLWCLNSSHLGSGAKPSPGSFRELIWTTTGGTLWGTSRLHPVLIDDLDGLTQNHQQFLRSALDVTWTDGYLIATSANPGKIDPALRQRMVEFVISPPDQPTLERWLRPILIERLGLAVEEDTAVGMLVQLGELKFRSILKILAILYAGQWAITESSVRRAALQSGFGLS